MKALVYNSIDGYKNTLILDNMMLFVILFDQNLLLLEDNANLNIKYSRKINLTIIYKKKKIASEKLKLILSQDTL